MSFSYIIRLFIPIFFLFVYSCNTIGNLKNNKNDNTLSISSEIDNDNNISLISLNISQINELDYYKNDLTKNFILKEKYNKKIVVKSNKIITNNLPLKIYISDNLIYGINSESELLEYNLSNGKLINSFKIKNDMKEEDALKPTSFSFLDNKFIIGYKSGLIVMVDRLGKVIWSYFNNQILNTPLKLYDDKLIALYGNTLKIIDIDSGNEIWSETYEGLPIYQVKGGSVESFVNLIYYILPNNIVGAFDTLLGAKHYSNFDNLSLVSSINNSKDSLHIFDSFVSYLDEGEKLYTFDILSNKFILNKYKVEYSDSNFFYSNALIIKNQNFIHSHNLINGKLFWSIDIEKIISKTARIINVFNIQNKLHIFFDNGQIAIITDKKIEKVVNLNIRKIDLIYFQDNRLISSYDSGKTAIF